MIRWALLSVTGFAMGFTAWMVVFDRSMLGEILVGTALSIWGLILVVKEAER